MNDLQEMAVREEIIATEAVARVIAGLAQIGMARQALEDTGMKASICGSRITVDGVIEAQLMARSGVGWWSVYAIDGSPPIWNVGTHCGDNVASWTGCAE